jgi:hypothetical protein
MKWVANIACIIINSLMLVGYIAIVHFKGHPAELFVVYSGIMFLPMIPNLVMALYYVLRRAGVTFLNLFCRCWVVPTHTAALSPREEERRQSVVTVASVGQALPQVAPAPAPAATQDTPGRDAGGLSDSGWPVNPAGPQAGTGH